MVGAEYPGTYNPFNSAAARVIPQKYFPLFNVDLSSNEYLVGETVTSKSSEGYDVSGRVETWDVKNEILVVSGTTGFSEGETVPGKGGSDGQDQEADSGQGELPDRYMKKECLQGVRDRGSLDQKTSVHATRTIDFD